jgi:hypothetical protein
MSWGKGLEEEDTFCYTTDSQVVGQKPIVERVNFQALPTIATLMVFILNSSYLLRPSFSPPLTTAFESIFPISSLLIYLH